MPIINFLRLPTVPASIAVLSGLLMLMRLEPKLVINFHHQYLINFTFITVLSGLLMLMQLETKLVINFRH